ncbi:PEP-CTERM sorting domain-containing protein [Calothrix sp. CCY 0018]|uniref:PEP-CTERM sorting domain-containing protein n=1 Tax=Calothrix sp. CCY 0018 TaxID=3103864 RepID=UPI0039C5EFDD
MNLFNKVGIAAITVVCAVGAVQEQASAVSFRSCSTSSYDISGKVTGTTNCTISDEFQDSVSPNKPLTVNKGEGFFGYTNWNFGGKIGVNGGFNGTGEGKTGSWNLSSVIEENWGDIMLVFKSGKGTTLVGYQLADGVESGTWKSPYEKAAFNFNGGDIKDVSHISVYYREGKKPVKRKVPEPTSILGLVGISAVVGSSLKRKRKSSSIELV